MALHKLMGCNQSAEVIINPLVSGQHGGVVIPPLFSFPIPRFQFHSKQPTTQRSYQTAQPPNSELCLPSTVPVHESWLPKNLNPQALMPKIPKAPRLPRQRYFKSTFLRVCRGLHGQPGENSWAKGQAAQGKSQRLIDLRP